MTDQATRDLLARGNVFSSSAGYVPVDSGSRDKTDYNANIPDKGGVVYTGSDPYQQQVGICAKKIFCHPSENLTSIIQVESWTIK